MFYELPLYLLVLHIFLLLLLAFTKHLRSANMLVSTRHVFYGI